MWKPLLLAMVLTSSIAHAEECPWMPDSRLDKEFPDRAPWTTMVGGRGRCKFVSDQRRPSSTLSLTQMVQPSPQAAESYVKTVGGGMAKTYQVTPAPALGTAGVAVREKNKPEGPMLTLIGHQKNIVVMAQLDFLGGVSAAQQAKAQELAKETFTLDTGGGLQMPK